MTVGLFVKLKVLPGKAAEFEAAFAEQAANCKKNEPGQQLYQLFRENGAPDSYFIMEMYKDSAALEVHRQGTHLVLTRDRVRACFDGKAELTTGEN